MKISAATALVAFTGLTGISAGVANAAIVGDAFTLTTSNTNGVASVIIPAAALTFDPVDNSYSYFSSGSQTLSNGFVVESFDVFYINDPVIALTFVGSSGGLATNVSITSATLAFAPIVGGTATASGGMTLTGNNGTGANMSGNFLGNAHNANFNTGTFFSNVGSFGVVAPNGSQTVSSFVGPAFVAGPITSMQTAWSFAVDADDSVSINSSFNLIPTPGALGLLGLGGLTLARRRR